MCDDTTENMTSRTNNTYRREFPAMYSIERRASRSFAKCFEGSSSPILQFEFKPKEVGVLVFASKGDCTAYFGTGRRDEALKTGAEHFVKIPVHLLAFDRTVCSFLATSALQRGRASAYDAFWSGSSIGLGRHLVYCYGELGSKILANADSRRFEDL
jgi:hypothetical protein